MLHRCLVCVVIGSMFVVGCGQLPVPELPAEAVLAGDWTALLADGDSAVVTFDAEGVVESVTWQGADGTTATQEIPGAITSLDGDAVTVQIPTANGDVVLEGTLSEDGNTMIVTLDSDLPNLTSWARSVLPLYAKGIRSFASASSSNAAGATGSLPYFSRQAMTKARHSACSGSAAA